jgi:hypothetical protein
METDLTIVAFLKAFKNNSELFSKHIQDLDRKLGDLENASNDERSTAIQNWYKEHSEIRNEVLYFEETLRDADDFPCEPLNDDSITNRFRELREAVKAKIKELQGEAK